MALIDEVRAVCTRLRTRGWGALLARHGLFLDAADLSAELNRKLSGIDRSIPGFEDFTTAGTRGIEPGKPAASLLYHALASPNVHPATPGNTVESYPTLAELDVIENYIYSLAKFQFDSKRKYAIAVFAYEYRPATSGAHIWHADLTFSRAGIARIGTAKQFYDPSTRGFRADPPGQTGMAVSPARYAAFIAEARRPRNTDPIMGRPDKKDLTRTFLFPVHKLFPGSECVPGTRMTLSFKEFHRNEKLRRIHAVGGIKVVSGFNVQKSPFVRDSMNGGNLVDLDRQGASILVVPRPKKQLVRTVTQRNSRTREDEIVRFVVPPATQSNRFSSSLDIPTPGNQRARRAPEYVNIRHRVDRTAKGFKLVDMKALPTQQFEQALKIGKYEAAHFADDTCDGALSVTARGLPDLPNFCAYSLVTAPDFFPLADQMEIANWVREDIKHREQQFAQGAPWPLCEGREPANLELPHPDGSSGNAFERRDTTVVAIVATQPLSRDKPSPGRQKRFASFLPDAASNVFAPGWDVSLGSDARGTYYAAYGLGSPFPEDSKLCAALNSFWPAAAPDASRTFRMQNSPTAIPLLDEEIGIHPDHPRAKAGAVASKRGWDGEYGPFFENISGKVFVNAANLDRSDYVSNSLRGQIDIRSTSGVTGAELTSRMDALRNSIAALSPGSDVVSTTRLWLVTAEAVQDWASAARADPALVGSGYVYVFARVEDKPGDGADLSVNASL